jgi:Bacterial Ig-like domain
VATAGTFWFLVTSQPGLTESLVNSPHPPMVGGRGLAAPVQESTLMRNKTALRRLAAVVQIALLAAGCVSVRTTGSHATGTDVGGVEVTVFADDGARKAGQVGPRFVVSHLERRQGETWQPVFHSLRPAWSVVDLPPGKYRLRFPAVLDDEGNAVRLDTEGKVFRVQKGKVAEVQTTLEHVPKGLIVAGVVTAVVAAVLLTDWFDDIDLPDLPEEVVYAADVAFHVTMDLAALNYCCSPYADRTPVVTSHFPEDEALVAARRVRVVFAVSEPLDPSEVESGAVTVLAEGAGLVAGTATYDPENWWLIWSPDADLPRGDTFHVTLAANTFEDLGGNELDEPVSFTFKTTP